MKKNKIEFTKIIVFVMTLIFFVFYIFSVIIWIMQGRYLSELAVYISRVFSIINSGYLVKSSIQNNVKIRKQFDEEIVKKPITFSKLIVIFISILFIISIIFFCIYWLIYNVFPSEIFEFIATPFITILPTYLAKAVVENYSLDSINIDDVIEKINTISTSYDPITRPSFETSSGIVNPNIEMPLDEENEYETPDDIYFDEHNEAMDEQQVEEDLGYSEEDNEEIIEEPINEEITNTDEE